MEHHSELGKIGRWLWHGGRLRVVQSWTTNGGVVFNVGEIVRLEQLVPYGGDSTLAGMYFVSEIDRDKKFYMTGWSENDDSRFEIVA